MTNWNLKSSDFEFQFGSFTTESASIRPRISSGSSDARGFGLGGRGLEESGRVASEKRR